MPALFIEIIGYLAAIIGTSLMLPQVVKTYKSKKVNDLSLGMLILYFLNCLLWLAYGIFIQAMPLIICNFVALLISIVQLAMKLKYSIK